MLPRRIPKAKKRTERIRCPGQPQACAELKPCPFCGGAWQISQEPHDNGYVAGLYYALHADAGLCVSFLGHFPTRDQAVAAINRRPALTLPQACAEIQQLAKRIVDMVRAEVPDSHPPRFKLFDRDAIAAVAEALAALEAEVSTRDAVVEECAKVAEDYGHIGYVGDIAGRIAESIRALKEKQPGSDAAQEVGE